MRFLAIDLGDRRTGLAVGDDETAIASPLRVVERPVGDALLEELAREAAAQGARALVVGLPLNMDGTEGPRARAVRAFGDRLAQRTGLPVHFQDERLTSADADWKMAQSGLTRAQKKARRDALAAGALLQDFLDARARGSDERGE